MQVEKFYYDNKIVKAFGIATIVFGIVGMLAGLWAAIQIYYPAISLNIAPTTFGRLRPLHTNAIIFAFVGNSIFTIPFSGFVKPGCSVINYPGSISGAGRPLLQLQLLLY